MRNLKVFLALGAGLAAAVVAACSSSSSGTTPKPGADAGDDGSVGDDGNAGPTSCIPVGAPSCNVKGGETCCFDITTISGTCVAAASCTKPIQVACSGGSSCATGQKCCANFGGASLASVQDGGLGALGIDASALSAEAGISQLGSALGGLMIDVSCKSACDPNTEAQECDTDTDCSGGATCQSVGSLAGDAGAALDAGAAAAGPLGSFAGAFTSTKVCVPPPGDGGTTVVSDAGPTEAGPTEAGPSDAGTASDAPAEAAH
jgi:hypothetical protein